MSVERSANNAVLRKHEPFDLEAAMVGAQAAATAAFIKAGMPAPKVMVNVAWVDGNREFSHPRFSSSKTPNRHNDMPVWMEADPYA